MAAVGANIQDELLPELEMSIIPSKLTDNVKVDLFRFSDDFLDFLTERGCISNEVSNDTQYMTMTQAIGLCKTVRDMYRVFNARAASANL
ncbi:hypothetical protein LCGC14_2831130 [marine sediment metagenome]|uniref:Uncharacterized protein n=1 Tax=marine sediment metagenome TaxID=412755 RepID=A0A0F8Z0S5_9ZZZZ